MQALFEIGPLLEAEALRKHIADQIAGQVDIWDACAEVQAERAVAEPESFPWPEPVGALFARDDVIGEPVLA
ncbi:hypothetical protein [Amycolatopsis sp. cmx-11-51]|uniref:hypothetical protein n=1 Tax=Amycolatopsis sp. cmx-11-51 TaxID=2785797 RepID=UPI0039E33080